MAITHFYGEYAFLSNFFPCMGSTLEHHYQAAKTDDPELAAIILRAKTPGDAKRLGRTIRISPTWNEERVPVMRSLLRVKFSRDSLRTLLKLTGDDDLIEGNTWHDNFWGCCTCQPCIERLGAQEVEDRIFAAGENMLGQLLMQTRTSIRLIGPRS